MDLLWLIPILPLLGATVNGIFGKRLPKSAISGIAVGSVGLSFLIAVREFIAMLNVPESQLPILHDYFTWIQAGRFQAQFGFMLDHLSGVMILIVTGVGFLIHVYSAGYMSHEDGFYRYFAYLNLFVFFMLTLVLANNYLLMFVGWEGVGLCSYLLIGFWFTRKSAADAGKKAFVVNRVGDFGFILAIMLIYWTFERIDFAGVFGRFDRRGGENLLPRVIQRDAIDQRRDDVHARIKRAGSRAPDLADAHSCVAIGDHHDTQRQQQRHDPAKRQPLREPPADWP